MSIATRDRFSLGTFTDDRGRPFVGMVLYDHDRPEVLDLHDLSALDRHTALSHDLTSLFALFDGWEDKFTQLRELHRKLQTTTRKLRRIPTGDLTVRAPYRPQQILCVGANYRSHVIEMLVAQPSVRTQAISAESRRAEAARMMDQRAATGEPYAFSKLPSCVVGPNDPIVLPQDVEKPDWELELAVIIGARARRVARKDALQYIAGFAIANDVTARERVYRKDLPDLATDFLAGKSAPTFLPFGPWVTPREFVDHEHLNITLCLNGQLMQNGQTSDMIFGVARQIEYLSSRIELWPGDLICTGSPAGNGMHHGRFLQPGDILEGQITGLGTLRNPCVAEPAITGRS